MQKLLTIIVPTYNMEAYLDKCLTSLIIGEADCNLMKILEIIVVNDGSTDRSSEIAHGYESRYPYTFKVIDKENGNYGSCINVALPLAMGKYIKTLDADDWFDTTAFKDFLLWLSDKDVDAVFTDFCKVRDGVATMARKLDFQPDKELQFSDHYHQFFDIYMHRTTYNCRVFHGLDYLQTEGVYYTDGEWMFLPLSRVKTFMYHPVVLYCYLFERIGQSMDPVVFQDNFSKRVELLYNYIHTYQACYLEGGKSNGISVNLDFLRIICLHRAMSIYTSLFQIPNKEVRNKHINQIEDYIFQYYPHFYYQLNQASYPTWYVDHQHLNFRIIHAWRKYGIAAVRVEMWLANHNLGIVERWRRFISRKSL